jgi:hypothetical protein
MDQIRQERPRDVTLQVGKLSVEAGEACLAEHVLGGEGYNGGCYCSDVAAVDRIFPWD